MKALIKENLKAHVKKTSNFFSTGSYLESDKKNMYF